MSQILYPTQDQIALVCEWANTGPLAIDPGNGSSGRPEKDFTRTQNLVRIRDLITRLDLPRAYETMRSEVLYRPVARIDKRLLHQFLASLRLHGYICRVGVSGKPVWAPVPLTAHQLHVIRMLSAGCDSAEIAAFFGIKQQRVSDTLRRARLAHGLKTATHLLSHCYRAGWLPTFREHAALMSAAVFPEGRPYIVMNTEEKGAPA